LTRDPAIQQHAAALSGAERKEEEASARAQAAMALAVGPHAIAVCLLIELYARPAEPLEGDGAAAARRLAVFLLREVLSPEAPDAGGAGAGLSSLILRLQQEMGAVWGVQLATALVAGLERLASPDDVLTLFQARRRRRGSCGARSRRRHAGRAGGEGGEEASLLTHATPCRPIRTHAHAQGLGTLLAARPGTASDAATAAAAGGAGALDPSSVLGRYLRRCRAAVRGLPFEQAAQLYLGVQAALDAARSGQPEVGGGGAGGAGAGGGAPRRADAAALDARLSEALRQVERAGRGQPLAATEARLRELGAAPAHGGGGGAAAAAAAAAGLPPKAHLVRAAAAAQHGDLLAAVHQLHQYFDYSGGSSSAGGGGGGGGGGDGPGGPGSASGAPAKGRGGHQSALLALSALHARAGGVEAAMRALSEGFKAARQSGDAWSQAHAVATLCAAMGGAGGGADAASGATGPLRVPEREAGLRALLRRCRDAAAALRCPHLAAYARLALARFALQHLPEEAAEESAVDGAAGEDGGPAGARGGGGSEARAAAGPAVPAALEVQRALRDVLLLQHATALAAHSPHAAPAAEPGADPAAAAPGGEAGPRPAGAQPLFDSSDAFGAGAAGAQPASAAATAQLACSAHLLQAAAWSAFGAASLAHLHAVTALACYGDACTPADAATAYAQLAQLLSASRGPAAAEALLAAVAPRFGHAPPAALAAAAAAAAHERAVCAGDAHGAAAAGDALGALREAERPLADELSLEARRCTAEAALAGGDVAGAHAAAGQLFAAAAEAALPGPAARGLLLLAEAHRRSGNPAAALPYALSALLSCRDLGLDLPAAEAAVAAAGLLQALAPADPRVRAHAAAMLSEVTPLVLAQGGLALRARTQLALAELCLAEAGQGGGGRDGGAAGTAAAAAAAAATEASAAPLRAAADAYGALGMHGEAGRALCLLAHVHHAGGRAGERDEAASQFLRCAAAAAAGGGGG